MTQQIEAAYTPPIARLTTRPTAGYAEYVKDFARLSAWYAFLIFLGVALPIGAIMYLSGPVMIILIALGLGVAGGGGIGLIATWGAHSAYTRHLGIATATTYQEPPKEPTPVRAFVPSANGTQTIRAGRFTLTRGQWRALFQSAGTSGKLTRDGATGAIPRSLYRDWQSTISELNRLGIVQIVDGDAIITPAGWRFYQDQIANSPHPTADNDAGAPTSTHARARTAAHDGV